MVLYRREIAELDILVASSESGGSRDKIDRPAENCGTMEALVTCVIYHLTLTAPLRSSTESGLMTVSKNAP